VKTGKIRRAFKHLPLSIHARAFDAALAVECAGRQQRYWSMHRQLFDNQGALASDDLRRHAIAVGLNESQFMACLDDADSADTVKADQAEARRLQVMSTPTFFVARVEGAGAAILMRRIRGAQPYSVFKTVLDAVEAELKQRSVACTGLSCSVPLLATRQSP
jgi:protein-disulfide isomerase